MTCVLGTLRYGDALLDFVPIQLKLTSTPMMADDGIQIKYHKITLNVTLIVSFDYPRVAAVSPVVDSVDAYMDFLRTELNTRGQELDFRYRGYGTNLFIPQGTEITYGPHPKVHEWEPLGNNRTIKLVWAVEAAVTDCPIVTQPTPSLPSQSETNPDAYKILQLVEDQELTFDESGQVTIGTNGTIEVAAGQSNPVEREALRRFIRQFLPNQLLLFQRTINFSFRKEGRIVDYRITDKEIPSDNPYFPLMVHQSVTHKINSQLEQSGQGASMIGGFTRWMNSMNGTFKVRPGVWKGWAWVAFMVAVNQRRNRSVYFTKADASRIVLDELSDPTQGLQAPVTDPNQPESTERKKLEKHQIPLSVEIEEELYERDVKCNMKWITTCSLTDLFKATGMFYQVHSVWQSTPVGQIPWDPSSLSFPPESVLDQWIFWKNQINNSLQNGSGYRNVQLPTRELLFGICTTDQSQEVINRLNHYRSDDPISIDFDKEANEEDSSGVLTTARSMMGLGNDNYNFSGQSNYFSSLDPDGSWISMKNHATVTEITNATYIPTLEFQSMDTKKMDVTRKLRTNKSQAGFVINGSTDYPDAANLYNNDIVQTRGKPIFKVRVHGVAYRMGYQIPCPVFYGFKRDANGQVGVDVAYRIGVNRWQHDLVNLSEDIPIYRAMWDNEYAVLGNMESPDIILNMNRNTEYV